MKNLINCLDRLIDNEREGNEFAPKSRPFRKVLESVQNGQEELGDSPTDMQYHFHSEAEIDMDLPCEMFISKNHYGHVDEAQFVERLEERLGLELYHDTPPEATTTTPPPSE